MLLNLGKNISSVSTCTNEETLNFKIFMVPRPSVRLAETGLLQRHYPTG